MPIGRSGPDPTPSEESVKNGLAALARSGRAALWAPATQPLFELPVVRRRVIDSADPQAHAVLEDALQAGIERMQSKQYRQLLKIVLGFDPGTRELSAAKRRQRAGEQFRNRTKPVTAGTIRTYHEPRALHDLASILIGLDETNAPAELKHDPVPQPLGSQLTCFVIGPIGNAHAEHGSRDRELYEDALRVMADVIEPACARYEISPVRADSLSRAGEITTQIFRRLHDDDIVIADLTDANPNVMYELGLRHTRDKLTIQIGEYGRLPFDISTIRTIQFSRSNIGLIRARDELSLLLRAGISGDFDPVTATRVWNGKQAGESSNIELPTSTEPDEAREGEDNDGYFVDILAAAEGPMEELPPAVVAIGESMVSLATITEEATEQLHQSDAAGKGMRGRLQVITAYATRLEDIATQLEAGVDKYVSTLDSVSAGMLVLIKRMEDDPDTLSEGRDFGMVSRRAAQISRDAMMSLGGLVRSIESNATSSRVLKEPSRRLTSALDRFAQATSVIDEWDRRLQALGIALPPPDWAPSTEVDASADGGTADAGQSGASEGADRGE